MYFGYLRRNRVFVNDKNFIFEFLFLPLLHNIDNLIIRDSNLRFRQYSSLTTLPDEGYGLARRRDMG